MQLEVHAQPRVLSRPILAGITTLLVIVGVVALVSQNSTAPTDSAVDTEAYTLAGFKVVKQYKCIFPTCTDFWCNANCNHKPSYCPASFCQGYTTKVAVPTHAPTESPTPRATDSPTPLPTDAPTPAPTCTKTNAWSATVGKLDAVKFFGAGACHPTICLGIRKKHWEITEEEMTTSPVLADQCTNCYCFGCSKTQFQSKCGGVAPTEAACTNSGCCPAECLGAIGNVKHDQCGNCKCSGCAPALFGYNCKSMPAACNA